MTKDEIVIALRCCAEGECHGCTIHNDKQRCQERVLDAAADVAPVVRCKDCYQSVVIGNVLHCTYWGKNTDENGYCHEGG